MKAMILAAGRGKRLRPLTLETPKPLIQVGGKPLIKWHLERLARAGITEVIINTAWLGQQIEETLGDGQQHGVRIRYSREGTPLETLGGIRRALPMLEDEGDFLVINGDVWTDFDPARLLKNDQPDADTLATLVLVANPDHHQDGDFMMTDAGQVLGGGEGTRYTFAGISRLSPELIHQASSDEERLGPLLKRAADDGRVRGIRHSGAWFDVGTHERLAAADAHVRQYGPS
ncbi:MurNAc alpha-1-phosphate uridylyltransferase [Halospina denitrificans]|uniref:MurNAc alpha-1-phosphate uridylyltransferase n=1 Tax=Halospina denitrificans TaxID=332522 RepID=A0A4R7JSG7_9GAMM|nr:nucleotidyltransferase family protein [Halospina denitrificans]TDT40223.1 MurNAc alpha-1-phosphate uridylyltransferase [Halospina denitrificans]